MNFRLLMATRISFFLLCVVPNILYGMTEDGIVLPGIFGKNDQCPIGEIHSNRLVIRAQEQEALTHISFNDLKKNEHGSLLGIVRVGNWYRVYEGVALANYLQSNYSDPETRELISEVYYYLSAPEYNAYTCIGTHNSKLVKKACKAVSGSALGAAQLGHVYKNGNDVTQDYNAALQWFTSAAHRGNATAMAELAFMYKHALGVPKDVHTSEEWRTKAAGEMVRIGLKYDAVQKFKRAHYWFLKATRQGSSAAMYNLALMYEQGEGVEKDDLMALTWYERAAAAGDADGYAALGTYYEKLNNGKKAQEYCRKAADMGNARGMFMVGRLIEKEQGLWNAAAQWYTKAAEKGYARAMKKMGDYCAKEYETDGLIPYNQAMQWYQKAVEAGDDSVILRLQTDCKIPSGDRGSCNKELYNLLIKLLPAYVRTMERTANNSQKMDACNTLKSLFATLNRFDFADVDL